jgi:hypothetical protein
MDGDRQNARTDGPVSETAMIGDDVRARILAMMGVQVRRITTPNCSPWMAQ